MEAKLPFKTIEVIDTRTGNPCKVACMSCIRGHRTTSCGKAVCRTKVFWTVKRPGRPANACTCPLGATGRCQCVIATSACTHRPKKGEARSVECRCDEQGRWCCVLEPDQWNSLSMGQRPRVDFYPNPETMNAAPMIPINASVPSTPSFSAGTPQTTTSYPGTPEPISNLQSPHVDMLSSNTYQTTPYETPRFGFMGVGSPLGNQGHIGEDVLKWDGQSPEAPREFQNYPLPKPANLEAAYGAAPLPTHQGSQFPYIDPVAQQYQNFDFAPVTQSLQRISVQHPGPLPAPPPRDKLMEDYYNFQFPGAICQNCGLAGCNCRACPAVMQNSIDGSWAQCCSRKHVRISELAQRGIANFSVALEHRDLQSLPPTINPLLTSTGQIYDADGLKPGGDQPFAPGLNVDEFGVTDGLDPMDISEFVMTDPDLPSHGCCCGGDT